MKNNRFVSIGECMIEMSGGADDLWKMGFAGDTLNTAWYARNALSQSEWSVDYITCLGDDRYSDAMLAFFNRSGLGTSHIPRLPGKRPGLYFIHQAEGDRHFTYWRENSAARALARDLDRLGDALADADCIYFSGITLAILPAEDRLHFLSAIETARGMGALIAFDPNIRPVLWPDRDKLRAAIERAAHVSSIVLPTHGDEAPIFGDADGEATARRYQRWGVQEIIVKDGAADALLMIGDDMTAIAAMPADRVVDPTGAGDSFNGTYLAARLGGAAPPDAVRRAHETAARVIAQHGALVAA